MDTITSSNLQMENQVHKSPEIKTDELKISLNKSLKRLNNYKQKTVVPEKQSEFTEYTQYHKCYEHEKSIYTEQTDSGLVNAFLLAYNNHLPLRLRPDDIHCALQMIFSTYVNNNAEKLRHLFVEHDGKKVLSVEYDKLDVAAFAELAIAKRLISRIQN